MATLHLLAHLEPLFTALARAYAVGGELLSIGCILWILNTAANLARLCYRAGQATGAFYKLHLHHLVKQGVIHYLTATLWLLETLWLGVKYIHAHRHQIYDFLATTLHALENLFTYKSPNVSLQPSSL